MSAWTDKSPGRFVSPRIRVRDTLREAISGLVQQPVRTALTVAGVFLGIAAFVASVGLTQSASGQIASSFNVQDVTTVRAVEIGDLQAPIIPSDGEARARKLPGVVAVGTWTRIGEKPIAATLDPRLGTRERSSVIAATPGLFGAVGATFSSGRGFEQVHLDHQIPVAVIGRNLASRIGLQAAQRDSVVFIDSQPYAVIGVLTAAERDATMLDAAIIPRSLPASTGNSPVSEVGRKLPPQNLLIETRVGANQVVAEQLPTALSPVAVTQIRAETPPRPMATRLSVSQAMNSLYVLIAGLTLIIGAAGIANIILVSVMQRSAEIGLRRAVGAMPSDIVAQFLVEAGFMGFLGACLGSAAGVGVVLGVCVHNGWTAIIAPEVVYLTPVVGLLIGVLAGAVPAFHAARIEPATALRGG